ncbi:sugar transferase [Aliiroseovarius crassostreae]|uniref:sugar transferase n=1 Tax=Aliiroseovarius crassostreae TaxID=154981 RepID=UPI003C7C29F3
MSGDIEHKKQGAWLQEHPSLFLLLNKRASRGILSSGAGGFYARIIKPALDVILVVLGLPLVALLFLYLYVKVRRDGGAFFYAHPRIGRKGVPFNCYKIRTMRPDADQALRNVLATDPARADEWRRTHKLRDDPRVTEIGKKLRKTGLDELPQLFNVLKGEMSLIGPRPITQDELDEYDKDGAAAYAMVRPGLTGLWQVTLRKENDFEHRAEIDAAYVHSLSFKRDMSILLRTVPEVLHARGC